MGFISAVRPVLPTADLPSHGQAGNSAGSVSASQSSGRASDAGSTEIANPVAQTVGTNASRPPLTDQSNLQELAKTKVEEAQRAYMMTLRAVGVNPLANRVP
ncbi:hypothetical protein HOY34_11425 [Xinfangfangia sp. D13-10-4-6]|uniref:hypothetical protein n=1 Tax=Pseudogemmobacter hezensis TaxID=2737662 RepID=UPI00155247D9|nr:hypothetical protein [Pseudogemmobacter hezensis]NPD15812.1 hypothetical protein [Pseudogemmobacter hezensis]